jgi:two-component system nitrate/nitrite response regulator NarL
MNHRPIRIVIADDHPIYRDGLRQLIERQPDFMLVGEATNGQQALDLIQETTPDILLLDLSMPQFSGIDVLRQISAGGLPLKIIVLTAAIEREQITEVLRLGARGVVLKDTATDLLAKSIRCVVDGEFWVGRDSMSGLVQALQKAGAGEPKKTFQLTPRELEIINAIVEGLSNKEIAAKCTISERTVKHHLSSIFDKVGVSNRVELALFSVNHNLV